MSYRINLGTGEKAAARQRWLDLAKAESCTAPVWDAKKGEYFVLTPSGKSAKRIRKLLPKAAK